MADDPKISQRYRELPREEPPRHVDDAILAAARRAADARPAPLVTPAGRRRWYFPLAAAAIIVLAVAVTVQVERQQRDVEVAEAPAAAAPPPREEQPAAPKREVFAPEPKPAPSLERRVQKAAAPLADLQEAPAPAQAQQAARARAEVSGVVGKLATVSPEQWLQGIADLRRQGRHEEADRQLAEFRKRYPDYRIPEAMLEKVEKR
jgi:hypothetical protein